MAGRVIFHIDMNAYFASCEQAVDPTLKGKKIAVAHKTLDKRGIILTASYEAKRCGVKTTMPIFEAERICPDLIVIEPHHHLYSEFSRKFFEYFEKITPMVEPASIDEGYLDVTDVCTANEYVDLAKKIQQDLLELFDLPCSIGIAPNKFLAKMASDMKKPLGITILRKRDIETMLWPLPIEDMFGAGKKTCALLRQIKVNTIGDLANYPDLSLLASLIGNNMSSDLINHAKGNGSNVVDPDRYDTVASISNSHTLDHDEYDINNVIMVIKLLSNTLANRMEKSQLKGTTFTLQLKYNNYQMVSKSISLSQPSNNSYQMIHLYKELFDDLYDSDLGVRLVGVAVGKLVKVKDEIRQMSIFDELDKESKALELNKVINNINNLIGSNLLKMGINDERNSSKIKRYQKHYDEK